MADARHGIRLVRSVLVTDHGESGRSFFASGVLEPCCWMCGGAGARYGTMRYCTSAGGMVDPSDD